MFSMAVRGGKAFAAEQKIRELKKRISRLSALQKNMKLKRSLNNIIKKAVDNMNSLPSPKYGIAPNEMEKSLYYQKCIENDSTVGVWVGYQTLSTDMKDTKEINIKKKKKA